MNTWIEDSNGNRCSIEYFGSKEAAMADMKRLAESAGAGGIK